MNNNWDLQMSARASLTSCCLKMHSLKPLVLLRLLARLQSFTLKEDSLRIHQMKKPAGPSLNQNQLRDQSQPRTHQLETPIFSVGVGVLQEEEASAEASPFCEWWWCPLARCGA